MYKCFYWLLINTDKFKVKPTGITLINIKYVILIKINKNNHQHLIVGLYKIKIL